MYFVVLNSRTDTYYNQETSSWTPHLVCATFFDFQTQADEIVNVNLGSMNLITIRETEDLSAAHIDVAVELLLNL